MPSFGDTLDNLEFDGRPSHLKELFKDKMKNFIEILLNPEDLVPKMFNNTPITSEELCNQIQELVEIFNKEELLLDKELIDTKAKLIDNIAIRKLKVNVTKIVLNLIKDKFI